MTVPATARELSAGVVGAAAVAVAAVATVAVLAIWLSGGAGFDVAWLPSWGARLAFRLDGLGALYGLLATGIGVAVFTYATAYLPRHLEHEGHRGPAGIGRRYETTGTNGGNVIVVITNSGHRIVHGPSPGDDHASAVELSDQQARKLGAILGGAFFKPAVVEELEAVFGHLLIDWVTLGDASPGAGKTIGELQIRRRTGVTIVAIVRGNQTITVPEPSETLHAGDRLVIIGRRQNSGLFHRLVVD